MAAQKKVRLRRLELGIAYFGLGWESYVWTCHGSTPAQNILSFKQLESWRSGWLCQWNQVWNGNPIDERLYKGPKTTSRSEWLDWAKMARVLVVRIVPSEGPGLQANGDSAVLHHSQQPGVPLLLLWVVVHPLYQEYLWVWKWENRCKHYRRKDFDWRE